MGPICSRCASVLVGVVVLLGCPAVGYAHDDCGLADPISSNSVTNVDLTATTTAASDPAFTCRTGGAGQGVGSAWYKFVATDTSCRVDTCLTTTPGTNSLVAVYRTTAGIPDICSGLVEIACNDDSCGSNGLLSDVCAGNLVVGQTYYIQIAAHSAAARGIYTMRLTSPCQQPCVTCPAGAVIESEANCGFPTDTVDGGCDSPTVTFIEIRCGDTVCGTSGVTQGVVDEDWYEFTTAATGAITWTVTAEFPFFTEILTSPCPGGVVGSGVWDVNCTSFTLTTPAVPAGTYRAMLRPIATGALTCGAKYVAKLDCQGGCAQCPPAAVVENEPTCGVPVDTVDGGCTSSPPVFISIQCGITVCGTGGTSPASGLVDQDWYQFALSAPEIVTWTVLSDFAPSIALHGGGCPGSILASASATAPCVSVSVSRLLYPGVYEAIVKPTAGPIVPCGTPYVGTLKCCACYTDLNGDCKVNTLDLGILLSHFGMAVPPYTLGDYDGDGVVTSLDLGKLLSTFGCGT